MPPAARKAEANPELPLEPIEPKPEQPEDIKFRVRIFPVIFQGEYFYRWEFLGHTGKAYVGDFTSYKDTDLYGSVAEAEFAANRAVTNIRHVAGLKLNQPAEHIIEL